MTEGSVKYYNEDKGYGFITKDDGGGEIFVHISNCHKNIEALAVGDRVRFEERISQRNGRPEAIAVELL